MPATEVLIADSQTIVREGLKTILHRESDVRVVAEAQSGIELRHKLPEVQPDVVIIDYALDGYFSVEDVLKIRELSPSTKILVITTDLAQDKVHRVLEYGVTSFLLKECDANEIRQAIAATSRNEKFFCGRVLDIILDKDRKPETDDRCAPTVLSKREIEIVGLIAKGLTTNQIAETLFLSAHTVNTHRKNILRKLGVKSSAEIILYAVNTSIIKVSS